MMLKVPSMLNLPSVTFVMVETLSHDLAAVALQNSLSKVQFGDVLVLSDDPERIVIDSISLSKVGIRTKRVPNWPSKLDWCRANWFTVPMLVYTSHILFCQWDAGVWDTNMWTDDYLAYDYIGALWPWHPAKRVGNSGFSLKSTALARYVYHHRDKYPCNSPLEDDLLCRTYRSDLEAIGFSWAPERLAHQFSFEGCGPNPTPPLATNHFGFHGAFNFAKVFDLDQLKQRAKLMAEDDYVRDSYMREGFIQTTPGLTEQLTEKEEESTDA